MTAEERAKIEVLIKEPPTNISDFLTTFDLVTEGLDLAVRSFLTTDEEKALLRQVLSRLHGDRDQIILDKYILNQTSPGCFS